MTVASLTKILRPAIVALCLAPVLVMGVAVPVRGASTITLRLDPASEYVMSDEIITLALWVDGVDELDRVELHLDYDWTGLQVQDADPGRANVQIQLGPIFCADCAPWNEVAGGEIHLVAYRDPLDGPFSGSGIVAYITFLVTATAPDTYNVSFDQVATQLLDSGGHSIAVDHFTDSMLVLPPPLVTLTGWVTRDGWGSDERTVVNAVLYPATSPYEPLSWGRACTDEAGGFVLETLEGQQSPPTHILPAGSPPTSPTCTSRWAFIRLEFTNHLSKCDWECADGDVQDIGWRDLEGGDVDGDGCITISDIVRIIGDYGEVVGAPCYIQCTECPPHYPPPNVAPSCDLNSDCQVNVLDLAQAAGNFGLCSNCP